VASFVWWILGIAKILAYVGQDNTYRSVIETCTYKRRYPRRTRTALQNDMGPIPSKLWKILAVPLPDFFIVLSMMMSCYISRDDATCPSSTWDWTIEKQDVRCVPHCLHFYAALATWTSSSLKNYECNKILKQPSRPQTRISWAKTIKPTIFLHKRKEGKLGLCSLNLPYIITTFPLKRRNHKLLKDFSAQTSNKEKRTMQEHIFWWKRWHLGPKHHQNAPPVKKGDKHVYRTPHRASRQQGWGLRNTHTHTRSK